MASANSVLYIRKKQNKTKKTEKQKPKISEAINFNKSLFAGLRNLIEKEPLIITKGPNKTVLKWIFNSMSFISLCGMENNFMEKHQISDNF